MIRWSLILAFLMSGLSAVPAQRRELDLPPHNYRQQTPQDRFTRLKPDLEAGRLALDPSSEKAYLLSLLRVLEIPASSQMLVFSTTSLQLSLISPRNPRAIFFNEDTYLGFIPGGRIEIVSIDPELGGIFYIFDIPRDERPPRPERAERCMNCHSGEDTRYVPGLIVKSVVPGPTGGSLDAFRLHQTGHEIPFTERFGGWYVTGQGGLTNHWGNLIGRMSAGQLTKNLIEPGKLFNYARYPMASSDVLPQLLHEHQVGFVNRAVEASYRVRELPPNAATTPGELDKIARSLTRYLLFADEAALPAGGVPGDATFKTDFLRTRRATTSGASLKDLELRTRLLQYRCSYMIYSSVFTGLPPTVRGRVYGRLSEALNLTKPDAEYAYLPTSEKQTIRRILQETLKDLPRGW